MSHGTDRENAPAFIVANFIVKNRDEYHKYEKGFFPLLKKHGGSFITYDDEHETLEGIAPRTGRMVIFTFPTEERARQWWADPEYQTLSEHRRAGCEMQFVTLVRGLPSRPTAGGVSPLGGMRRG
jgi:uncharacterized protein (DUF1330 family)